MAKDIVFSSKLQPLFRPTTRYIVLIGGRAGGKSFAVAAASALTTYDSGYNVLILRYTMESAEVSVIPEFQDKLALLNAEQDFVVKRRDVVNRSTGSRIFFRGMKSGSRLQTAHLKSLHKVRYVVVEEAEELTHEEEFDKVDDSLREKDADIHVVLVLNQSDVNHWIYRRFYREPELPDDFCGVCGDVTYIPITYLDNLDNLDESFLAKVRKMKEKDPEKYEHVYGLAWLRQKAGLIFTDWVRDVDAVMRTKRSDSWYGVDWGFTNDPTAIVRIWRDSDTDTVYLSEVCYRRGMLIGQIAAVLRADMEACGGGASLIYCDPARPEHIVELRRVYNLDAMPAVNRNKPDRVDWVKGCRIVFWGDHIEEERSEYSYVANPRDPEQFTNIPQDGGDHLMDAINYGVWTHLHRLGVPNALGQE